MQQNSPNQSFNKDQGIQHFNHQSKAFDQDHTKPISNDRMYFSSQQLPDNKHQQLLNTANQILPAHKNYQENKQKISFKLSSLHFNQNKQRFNQTAFPVLNFNKDKNNGKNQALNEGEFNFIQELGEFSGMMNDKKVMIYQRIKNDKINYFNRGEKNKEKGNQRKINNNKYFCSIFINPKLPKNHSKQIPVIQHLNKLYQIDNPNLVTDNLAFQSRFQSGNLFAVFRDYSELFPTYELFMQNDINTKGSTQWFYFKVTSKARTKVKFKILNFYKPTSLFQQGMKVLVSTQGQQWKRVGTAISYSKNKMSSNTAYALEFIYEFQNTGKNTYFAYGYPYNYTQKLVNFVDNIIKKNYTRKCIGKQILCKTNMGNQVYLLSITNNALNIKSQKPIIYVIGRQHPGQTPASYVMEGFINFLLSNRLQAESLRQQFEFKIVPMVNVDGVISGNYRTNISGNDVNRQWIFPSKTLHPQIYYLKQEIISNKRNVVFFLDIHAHSRKMNSFFYGSSETSKQNKFFPFVCSKLNKFISYSESSFSDDASKQSTGRVVIQKQLNLTNSLTFQISFYGYCDSKKTKQHFKPADLQQIGMSLALGFYYTQISIKKVQSGIQSVTNIKNEKLKTIHKNSLKIYQKWKIQIQKQTKQLQQALSQGSSIDPQHFQLRKQQVLNIQNQNNILSNLMKQNQKNKLMKQSKENAKQALVFQPNILNQLNTLDIKGTTSRYYKILKKVSNINKVLKLEDNIQQTNSPNNKSNLFSFSSNQFFLLSSRDFMVKQLEGQLQNKKQSRDVRYMSIDENQIRKKKIQIDFRQTSRYHDRVNQLKKSFNYCINNQTDLSYFNNKKTMFDFPLSNKKQPTDLQKTHNFPKDFNPKTSTQKSHRHYIKDQKSKRSNSIKQKFTRFKLEKI